MVHTRNGSNYSVQPDGCGQGRGKTRTRSSKSYSRKKCLEDARVAPHSPRSLPTKFDINSESELIQGNVSSAEPFKSGSHRNISVPVQKLVQSSQGRGVGNMPKPLEGGYELLLAHQEISGSGEDHKALRVIESSFLQRQDQKKELEMTPAFEKEGPVVSISSKLAPEVSKDKPKGPQKKQRGPKNNPGKGKVKANWQRPYPQGYRMPKLDPSAVESVFNLSRTLMEFTAKEQERMNRNFKHK
ncbi:hypothetical protein O181_102076 [Austropuccinia psidii MF-1]|uniref:Uncharacterized protein n=1 Tax=Austropuccinia psidii MF-1 TaxID=1389203 RepID=A0A9Q3JHZ0_9BASI|nr:hypothetical protein [Austropuccinia psidii MF-1]